MRKVDIYCGNNIVGFAEVNTIGLYHYIKCYCHFNNRQIYKIQLSGEHGTINLGTCAPFQNGYYLEKKVSVRSVGNGELTFSVPMDGVMQEKIIPLSEDKPFEYIDKLCQCILIRQGDALSVFIRNRALMSQDNDLNQESGDRLQRR